MWEFIAIGQDNSMTKNDLKLETWYKEDNGWNKLWFYGLNETNWIIYDPDSSGSAMILDNIEDDSFEEHPPKIDLVNPVDVIEMLLEYGFDIEPETCISLLNMLFKNIQML